MRSNIALSLSDFTTTLSLSLSLSVSVCMYVYIHTNVVKYGLPVGVVIFVLVELPSGSCAAWRKLKHQWTNWLAVRQHLAPPWTFVTRRTGLWVLPLTPVLQIPTPALSHWSLLNYLTAFCRLTFLVRYQWTPLSRLTLAIICRHFK